MTVSQQFGAELVVFKKSLCGIYSDLKCLSKTSQAIPHNIVLLSEVKVLGEWNLRV